MKKLEVKTKKGTRNYDLSPAGSGFDVQRVDWGLLSSKKTFIGHGGSLSDAVLVARVDAGDHLVTTTRLHD